MVKQTSTIIRVQQRYHIIYLVRGEPRGDVELTEFRSINGPVSCGICGNEIERNNPGFILDYKNADKGNTYFLDRECYERLLDGDFDDVLTRRR